MNTSQFRKPRIQECGETSGYVGQNILNSNVSSDSNPILAQLRSSMKGKNTSSIRELYEQQDDNLDKCQIMH